MPGDTPPKPALASKKTKKQSYSYYYITFRPFFLIHFLSNKILSIRTGNKSSIFFSEK